MTKFNAKRCVKYVCIFTALALLGCGRDTAHVAIVGLNYKDKPILSFSVNGYGGASIPANDGGGGFVCCVGVPLRWHKGLRVKVKWSDNEDDFDSFKERDVEIPEYGDKDLGFLAIHFFPDDSVKALLTNKTAEYPGYPFPRPSRQNAS